MLSALALLAAALQPLVSGYPSKVAVNPCGMPYPRFSLENLDYDRIQKDKLLYLQDHRIKGLSEYLKEPFGMDFKKLYNIDPKTWIPNGDSLDSIQDLKGGLAEANHLLKYFSFVIDILQPALDDAIFVSNCPTVMKDFQAFYRNHTELVCETDEAMRMATRDGALPAKDYPTFDFVIPPDWANMNPFDCTRNTLSSRLLVRNYRRFLSKFNELLEKHTSAAQSKLGTE